MGSLCPSVCLSFANSWKTSKNHPLLRWCCCCCWRKNKNNETERTPLRPAHPCTGKKGVPSSQSSQGLYFHPRSGNKKKKPRKQRRVVCLCKFCIALFMFWFLCRHSMGWYKHRIIFPFPLLFFPSGRAAASALFFALWLCLCQCLRSSPSLTLSLCVCMKLCLFSPSYFSLPLPPTPFIPSFFHSRSLSHCLLAPLLRPSSRCISRMRKKKQMMFSKQVRIEVRHTPFLSSFTPSPWAQVI